MDRGRLFASIEHIERQHARAIREAGTTSDLDRAAGCRPGPLTQCQTAQGARRDAEKVAASGRIRLAEARDIDLN
jgi:hypothetical protein